MYINLCHLNKTLCDRPYYYLHYIDEEMSTERLNSLTKDKGRIGGNLAWMLHD